MDGKGLALTLPFVWLNLINLIKCLFSLLIAPATLIEPVRYTPPGILKRDELP